MITPKLWSTRDGFPGGQAFHRWGMTPGHCVCYVSISVLLLLWFWTLRFHYYYITVSGATWDPHMCSPPPHGTCAPVTCPPRCCCCCGRRRAQPLTYCILIPADHRQRGTRNGEQNECKCSSTRATTSKWVPKTGEAGGFLQASPRSHWIFPHRVKTASRKLGL